MRQAGRSPAQSTLELAGLKTKREVLERGLTELVRQQRIEHLLSLMGRTDLNLTQEQLERSREDEHEWPDARSD